jgi:hypothetical protein
MSSRVAISETLLMHVIVLQHMIDMTLQTLDTAVTGGSLSTSQLIDASVWRQEYLRSRFALSAHPCCAKHIFSGQRGSMFGPLGSCK